MSTRTAVGVGATVIAGLLLLGAVSTVMERTPTTDLPPDPFESDEPRELDCVARWNNYHGTKANFYCEIRLVPGDDSSLEDYYDEDGIERSPFIWSSTARTGNEVYMDVELQGRWVNMDGDCEVWIDGDHLLGRDEMEEDDEGVWFCRVEVVIP